MQTCSPRFCRPGTGRAAAGLHFGLGAPVSAPQYGILAPVRPSTSQVGWYAFPTIITDNIIGRAPQVISSIDLLFISRQSLEIRYSQNRRKRVRAAPRTIWQIAPLTSAGIAVWISSDIGPVMNSQVVYCIVPMTIIQLRCRT